MTQVFIRPARRPKMSTIDMSKRMVIWVKEDDTS